MTGHPSAQASAQNTDTPGTDTKITDIQITVDGEPHTLAGGSTVRDLVQRVTGKEIDETGQAAGGKRLGVAVAVDGAVVPRSRWAATVLATGSTVDIVTAAQGG